MKKILMMTALVMAFSVSALIAQQQPKIDVAMKEKLIQKSDADIAHPKRSTKSYTWLDRGKLLFESYVEPVNGLYDGKTEDKMIESYGKGTDLGLVDKGAYKEVKAVEYPNFIVYYIKKEDQYVVAFWDQKLFIKGASLAGAAEAYVKVAELDKSKTTQETVAKELGKIANQHKIEANNYQDHGQLKEAADACLAAYEVSIMPPLSTPDVQSLYYAGYLYTSMNMFEEGAKYLQMAADQGVTTEGDTYYFIAYAYTSLKQNDKALASLEEGVKKFPNNEKMVEMLATIYSNSDDPDSHLEFVERAANIFNKPDLWNAVGRIYDKAGENEKAVASFKKALALDDTDYASNFNLGLMYVKAAVAEAEIVNKTDYLNQVEYDAALSKVIELYRVAMVPLEKAVEANPGEIAPVELIMNMAMRMRDKNPEMKVKYDKYVQIYKALGGTAQE